MAGPPAPLAALPGSDGRPRPGQRPACLPTHGPHMNFHEYQAKQLFADYGIAVPAGRVARTPEEAVDAAKAIGGDFWVVKAQIHAGGRGKAGGVKLARTLDEVRGYAKGMIGQTMETYQSAGVARSEEHTSELQSLMRISYAVFFMKQKKDSRETEE